MAERNIDSRVSPSYHPDNLNPHRTPLDVEGTPGCAALRASEQALGQLHDARVQIEDAKVEIWRDGTRTEDAKLDTVATLGEKTWERVGKVTAHAEDEINRQQAALVHRMDTALRPAQPNNPANVALAQEVRAHAARLNATERMALVRDAASKGDVLTLSAVLDAPAYLSGLDDATQSALRVEGRRVVSPDDAAQHDTLGKVRQKLNTAIGRFVTDMETDAASNKVKDIRERSSAAQRALQQV